MTTYNAKDMRSKAGQMLDQARRGEEVVIMRRGAERFVLRYEPDGAHSGEHLLDGLVSTSGDDLLGQLISGQNQTNDLLRELIEQSRDTSDLDEILDSRSQPAVATRPSMVTVEIPESMREPEPEVSAEPSEEELKAAYNYFGLVVTRDGLAVNQHGMQGALAGIRKIAREDPDSEEARIMALGAADDERIEFLRCVQLSKLSSALAKRAEGYERWLGAATPRF